MDACNSVEAESEIDVSEQNNFRPHIPFIQFEGFDTQTLNCICVKFKNFFESRPNCLVDLIEVGIQEYIMSLEKDVSVHVDKMVEIGLQEYFAHMIDFVKQYAKDENEGGGYVQDKNVNFKLIENISAEFSENWIKRVEAFKDLCYKNFNNSGAFKKIMKKFLQNLLNSYGKFNKYVKENYSGFANSIPQLHMIMKEIQNQEKKLAVWYCKFVLVLMFGLIICKLI